MIVTKELLKVDIHTRFISRSYSMESIISMIENFNERIAEGESFFGEYRKNKQEYDEISDTIDLNKVSHIVNGLFLVEDILMAEVNILEEFNRGKELLENINKSVFRISGRGGTDGQNRVIGELTLNQIVAIPLNISIWGGILNESYLGDHHRFLKIKSKKKPSH